VPYLGVDSWRWQYFENEPCPDDVVVPVDDATGWTIFPKHRWVYNKLLICETQGLPHGPHGTLPDRFPVFSKPIYNMKGMGTGGRVIDSLADYEAAVEPGYMWMPYFTGEHVSTDVALRDGRVLWWRHTTGLAGVEGTFDYWTIHAETMPALDARILPWLERNLAGFTGVINLETIDGAIIECHLRMAEQWLDLNGEGWLKAVVALYTNGGWPFVDRPRSGYSVVLFGAHGVPWRIDRARIAELKRTPGVSSIQITFEEDVPAEHHAMPPGGFRLAIVNCWDLEAGRAVRARLRELFSAGLRENPEERQKRGEW
jgi:hypothetical protein